MTKNNAAKIIIVDYGMGNIGSIVNMLRFIGFKAEMASRPENLQGADKVILPGVGNFGRAMSNLNETGMADALKDVANRGLPILGICLGMQLMCKTSEEGSVDGLGFVDAHTKKLRFEEDSRLKVPHMGWNKVDLKRNGTILGDFTKMPPRYYFVHSYYVYCEKSEDIIGTSHYGINFVSAFQNKNIIGVQFHPEKSHQYGMQLLKNFVTIKL